MSIVNRFSTLQSTSAAEPTPMVHEVSHGSGLQQKVVKTAARPNWSDIEEELTNEAKDERIPDIDSDIQFPRVGEDPKVVASHKAEERRALQKRAQGERRKRDSDLKKIQEITISYGPQRSRNRTVKVMDAQAYIQHLTLSDKMKTHDKLGNINKKDLYNKIKLANDVLLKRCYKHPTKPFCFVYAVAEIELEMDKQDGDEQDRTRIITVNEILTKNERPFTIIEKEYYTE